MNAIVNDKQNAQDTPVAPATQSSTPDPTDPCCTVPPGGGDPGPGGPTG